MVSKFTQPDMTSQDAATYKASIDGAIAVLKQMGAGLAPRAPDTPGMNVTVDPGVLFKRGTGNYQTFTAQNIAVTAPGSNSRITRIYMTAAGVLSKVDGVAAASPVAPDYPADCIPIAQVLIATGTTGITNAMITDERVFNTGLGTPKNTFLVTASGVWNVPANAKFLRITAAGGGGGSGGGASNAGGTSHAGGGAGGGAAAVIARLFAPENLNITIGAGGSAGVGGASNGNNGTAGGAGGTTTVTAVTLSGIPTFSCAGGNGGNGATAATPTVGAPGAGGAAGTGVAGTTGSASSAVGAAATGGRGGGVGTGGQLSVGGAGGTISPASRDGVAGVRGSGAGSGVGTGGDGALGGDGFVLIEVF
jgi:hypothetical protein